METNSPRIRGASNHLTDGMKQSLLFKSQIDLLLGWARFSGIRLAVPTIRCSTTSSSYMATFMI